MSKSYGNYIGLTDPADEMFGKVMSIPDVLMVKYYRLCTPLSVDEVDRIEAEMVAGTAHPNATKRHLARAIVELYHGAEDAASAEEAFDRVFKHHEAPDDVPDIEVPLTPIVHLPAMLRALGLVTSNAEGRRMIDAGAVRVEGDPVPAHAYDLPWDDLVGRVIQAGKRRFARPVAPR
jgi:tyrosyl-tRNA synthetase